MWMFSSIYRHKRTNDKLVPWTHKYLERDEAFVQSDPFDGHWNEDSEYKPVRRPGENVWSPWDDIYAGQPHRIYIYSMRLTYDLPRQLRLDS